MKLAIVTVAPMTPATGADSPLLALLLLLPPNELEQFWETVLSSMASQKSVMLLQDVHQSTMSFRANAPMPVAKSFHFIGTSEFPLPNSGYEMMSWESSVPLRYRNCTHRSSVLGYGVVRFIFALSTAYENSSNVMTEPCAGRLLNLLALGLVARSERAKNDKKGS